MYSNSYTEFIENFKTIKQLNKYSEEKLKLIKKDLNEYFKSSEFKDEISVITTGSYGRMEASDESDMDFFIIYKNFQTKNKVLNISTDILDIIQKKVPKNTGSSGTFGRNAINTIDELTSTIGGQNDSNELLTRRMLFLLEGKPIFNDDIFNEYRIELIKKYLEPTKGLYFDRYLINDIIRYYRTIATDFQFKVDISNKSWGLRNIKLKFSRKILYYSGIISVIFTYLEYKNSAKINKEDILLDLLNMPVSERIHHIITFEKNNNTSNDINKLFEVYDLFLQYINSHDKRSDLESLDKDLRSTCETYRILNDKSKFFTNMLYTLTCNLSKDKDDVLEFLIF